MQSTTKQSYTKLRHRQNRRIQRRGNRERKHWRELPATAEQLAALRRIAKHNGHTFALGVTRGEAWLRIRQATSLIDEAHRLRCAPPWYTPPAA